MLDCGPCLQVQQEAGDSRAVAKLEALAATVADGLSTQQLSLSAIGRQVSQLAADARARTERDAALTQQLTALASTLKAQPEAAAQLVSIAGSLSAGQQRMMNETAKLTLQVSSLAAEQKVQQVSQQMRTVTPELAGL